MENKVADPTLVLKVNIKCCKACPEKLKKGLLQVTGVDHVSIDVENKLVYVRGSVDPKKLVKKISDMGKTAKLLFCDTIPEIDVITNRDGKNNKSKGATDRKCKIHGDNVPDCAKASGHKAKKYIPPKEPVHEIESCVPPPDATYICKDVYCKIHDRRKIIQTPPMDPDSAPMPWQHLQNGHPYFHPYGVAARPSYDMGYGAYYHGRPPTGFDHSNNYHGNYARGCNQM